MGISIGDSGGDPSGAVASLQINTAIQAQIDASQTADVEALFGSLGIGGNSNSIA